ncbi:nucleolar and coiled-body phosphoprotein 1-like [Protopterus annectens]|uniref:nucleolar and coiled-body phosphoprotein 1-like n=1 Tax=Protopterus annectens TaxID=7888 RepID=UPI001CFBDE2E|nr:nucleolar and coiled-body phosphoprotein 1-like [Protopterus annectens]
MEKGWLFCGGGSSPGDQSKSFPSQTPLEDIYKFWAKSPENLKRKSAEVDGASSAKKQRVADPDSSMESSEEESATKVAPGLKPSSGSTISSKPAAVAKSSEDSDEDSSEDESSEEEDKKSKGQVKGTPSKLLSGKQTQVSNVTAVKKLSTSTPNKISATAPSKSGPATPKSKNVPAKATTPAKAGAVVKKEESSETDSSDSSESEKEKTRPPAVGTTKPGTSVIKKDETSSEETDSEDEDDEEKKKAAQCQGGNIVNCFTKDDFAFAVSTPVPFPYLEEVYLTCMVATLVCDLVTVSLAEAFVDHLQAIFQT